MENSYSQFIQRRFRIATPEKIPVANTKTFDVLTHLFDLNETRGRVVIERRVAGGAHVIHCYFELGFAREKVITYHEYLRLLHLRDIRCEIINRRRHAFIYENQSCRLDILEVPRDALAFLAVDVESKMQEVDLPLWLHYLGEVTDNQEYDYRSLVQNAVVAA